jgi:hypothetical protein
MSNPGSLLRGGIACLYLSLVAACASPVTATDELASARSALAATRTCCSSLAEAPTAELPAPEASVPMDKTRPVLEFDGSKSYFVLYRLPKYAAPYSIRVESIAQEMAPTFAGIGTLNVTSTRERAVFVPRVRLLDATFDATRIFDDQALRTRGDNLELTIFVNARNAGERYIVIYGASRSGSTESSYADVTSTPLYAGGVVGTVVFGQEAHSRLNYSPIGKINLLVDRPVPLPQR